MDSKICQNIKPPTPTQILWGRLEDENTNSFYKCPFFSYSLLPKILKFRSSLRFVFLIKIVYNQFLLLKNYRIWY